MGKDLLFEVLPKDSNGIVFLGDSHTELFLLTELLGKCEAKNRGISGDRLSGMMKRITPIIESRPKKIFIQGGINDLGTGVPKDTVIAHYKRLISYISANCPDTKIYVQGVFPVENKIGKLSSYCNPQVNKAVVEINSKLQAEAKTQGYTFIDIYTSLAKDGKLNPAYSFDGIHLTPEGYLVWADLLKPYL